LEDVPGKVLKFDFSNNRTGTQQHVTWTDASTVIIISYLIIFFSMFWLWKPNPIGRITLAVISSQ
jgi:hypothetical protein